MNNHAVCPTLPSHKDGSDMHGNLYTMIWKEQFPHDGEYIFRGICDDIANVYLDGEKIMSLPGHKEVIRSLLQRNTRCLLMKVFMKSKLI